MEQTLTAAVMATRAQLRSIQLQTLLTQFDRDKMQLTTEAQLAKYEKMSESPFRFFRGSAYVYYYDISNFPSPFDTPSDKPTWIMGDMHMDNFGAFQNEQGVLVYDVNDFDEGYIGSYTYDILRMAISISLYLAEQGHEEAVQKAAIQSYLRGYVKQLKRFASKKEDALTLSFSEANTKGPIKRVLKKLKTRQRMHFIEDITEVQEDGTRSFRWSEELQPVDTALREEIANLLPQYAIRDIAFKHGSGTASIGLDRFYILVDNYTDAAGFDHLILEMKEVRTAIPAYFTPYHAQFWTYFNHQGARVIGTQKAMHHLQDPHLHAVTLHGKEYYVRERSPFKRKVKPKHYRSIDDYYETTRTMGKIAAKIHARADQDYSDVFTYNSEEEILRAIGQNEESFYALLTLQAMRYKEVVYRDYELFLTLVEQLKQ